jgi:hypothetical protein
LVFINIHYFLLDFALLLGRLGALGLFFKLVSRDVDQVGDVSGRLCVFDCLPCSEAEALLLLAHLVGRGFLLSPLILLLLFLAFLFRLTVVGDVPYGSLVDVPELEEQFSHLPQ